MQVAQHDKESAARQHEMQVAAVMETLLCEQGRAAQAALVACEEQR